MDDIRDNWTTIKETIRREYNISPISFKTWVDPLKFHNIVNDVVNIIIVGLYVNKWINVKLW